MPPIPHIYFPQAQLNLVRLQHLHLDTTPTITLLPLVGWEDRDVSVPLDMYDVMSQMIFICLFSYLFNYITLCLSLMKSDHICTFMYEIHEQRLLNQHILKLHEKPAISQVVRTDSANIYHIQEGD